MASDHQQAAFLPAVQLHHDFPTPMIIYFFELANVACIARQYVAKD
jgi:hypothetical protein